MSKCGQKKTYQNYCIYLKLTFVRYFEIIVFGIRSIRFIQIGKQTVKQTIVVTVFFGKGPTPGTLGLAIHKSLWYRAILSS